MSEYYLGPQTFFFCGKSKKWPVINNSGKAKPQNDNMENMDVLLRGNWTIIKREHTHTIFVMIIEETTFSTPWESCHLDYDFFSDTVLAPITDALEY